MTALAVRHTSSATRGRGTVHYCISLAYSRHLINANELKRNATGRASSSTPGTLSSPRQVLLALTARSASTGSRVTAHTQGFCCPLVKVQNWGVREQDPEEGSAERQEASPAEKSREGMSDRENCLEKGLACL